MNWFLDTLKNRYADFNGRARRKEYWMFFLFFYLIAFLIVLPAILLPQSEILKNICIGIGVIYILGMLIPNIAVQIRRLHDIGKPAWLWVLLIVLSAVPFVGVLAAIILLIFSVLDSEPGTNKYGENPKGVQKEA